jgi:hypothetical protein
VKERVYIGKDWAGGHRLIIVRDKPQGKIDVVSDFVCDEYQEGESFDHGSGIGRADDLVQAIIDRAWEAGFRPAGFAEIKNETAAVREHLTDMRTIAFHKLGIK